MVGSECLTVCFCWMDYPSRNATCMREGRPACNYYSAFMLKNCYGEPSKRAGNGVEEGRGMASWRHPLEPDSGQDILFCLTAQVLLHPAKLCSGIPPVILPCRDLRGRRIL